jgi:hypothetical protein
MPLIDDIVFRPEYGCIACGVLERSFIWCFGFFPWPEITHSKRNVALDGVSCAGIHARHTV